VGRDALQRVAREGVSRKLVGVEIAGEKLPFNATPLPVLVREELVGRVTSVVWSPRLARNIGYAMAPVAQAAIGTRLTVRVPSAGDRVATVVPMPFVDQRKAIPKS